MSALGWATIAVITLAALAFALWPLLRRRASGGETPEPARPADDRRLELEEEKAAVYRALKELEFDHEAGHLSEDDYRPLRERYEARVAPVLAQLDALGPAPAPTPAPAPRAAARAGAAPHRGWTRHPAVLAGGAVVLLAFGVLIGLNARRFSEPADPGMPFGAPPAAPGGPLLGAPPAGAVTGSPQAGEAAGPLPPEVMGRMLVAARQSLFQGRYQEAIAAYQAVLKRDAKNVDAMTHMALIVAIGGHVDAALESFDRALALDPNYAPAHLYRGEILYETKQDVTGAIQAWERFLALVPSGPEHDRVAQLVREARAKQPARRP